jgi:hypothetical protein
VTVNLSSTLEQLDGEVWADPDEPTTLVADVHRLRRVPIGELSNGDLRMLLGQRVGADWLVPVALDRLADAPLAGDWYPGDLLRAVLHAAIDYWPTHPDELMRLWNVRESLEKLRADAAALLANEGWPPFG